MSTTTGEQAVDVAYEFLVILHRDGCTRAQAIDSLHSVANELVKPFSSTPPTPTLFQRKMLDCVDTLRAAATVLADHDRGPSRWTPNEVQYDHHATTDSAESPTVAAAPPTPPTDAPPPTPPCPPGLDESEYVRARLATQYPLPASERRT